MAAHLSETGVDYSSGSPARLNTELNRGLDHGDSGDSHLTQTGRKST